MVLAVVFYLFFLIPRVGFFARSPCEGQAICSRFYGDVLYLTGNIKKEVPHERLHG